MPAQGKTIIFKAGLNKPILNYSLKANLIFLMLIDYTSCIPRRTRFIYRVHKRRRNMMRHAAVRAVWRTTTPRRQGVAGEGFGFFC